MLGIGWLFIGLAVGLIIDVGIHIVRYYRAKRTAERTAARVRSLAAHPAGKGLPMS